MSVKRNNHWRFFVLAAIICSLFELRVYVGEAHAVVGRPATPMSYAGVARRSVRTPAVGARPAGARYW